jgi:hypothetical protein
MHSNSASSAAVLVGDYLHYLSDMQMEDGEDDSDDEDYEPPTDEDSDGETAAAPAERPKRHLEVEPVGLDRSRFFPEGAVKTVDAPVDLHDCLYADVPESELLSLLDSSASTAFNEAVVYFFFFFFCPSFFFFCPSFFFFSTLLLHLYLFLFLNLLLFFANLLFLKFLLRLPLVLLFFFFKLFSLVS